MAYEQINQAAIEAGEVYLNRPPERMKPDRTETVAAVGSGYRQKIGEGAEVEWLVGAYNKARNLATGLLTLSPSSGHALHCHHVEEAITLLQGTVTVEVEDRRYELRPLDNLVIHRGLSHRVVNPNASKQAVLHVAFPIATPTASPGITRQASRWAMMRQPPSGPKELFNRFAEAPRYEASANATFIQYFNDELVPGISMCGGYGLFGPGGRLPAHIHDCDESICIIQGTATCWVEGRRYDISDCSTALQPRGRVHYFINNTSMPMAMIWVYAAPTAARIVVDERCAVERSIAWPGEF